MVRMMFFLESFNVKTNGLIRLVQHRLIEDVGTTITTF